MSALPKVDGAWPGDGPDGSAADRKISRHEGVSRTSKVTNGDPRLTLAAEETYPPLEP